jgi:shikimate dehydrogenase
MEPTVKKLFLLGHPVSHSLSPAMQNAALRSLGLSDWTYSVLDVASEDLVPTLEKLQADPDVAGCNVTVPHKIAVYEWLGASRCHSEAWSARAVNTLLRDPKDRRFFLGDSTDFMGACEALWSEGLPDCPERARSLQGHDIAILGTGGSAQSVARGFAGDDSLPRSITVFGRNLSKAQALADQLRAVPRGTLVEDPTVPALRVEALPLPDFAAWNRGRRSIAIQTTTVGLGSGADAGLSPVPEGSVSGPDQIAFDLVYKPHETPFLRDAAAHGARIVHGIRMLVGQGAWSLEHWIKDEPRVPAHAFGCTIPCMEEAVKPLLS